MPGLKCADSIKQ